MTTIKNRLLTFILTLVFVGISLTTGFAGTTTSEINVDEYGVDGTSSYPARAEVYSYLTTSGDKYMRVQCGYDWETEKQKCFAVYYDSDFNYLERKAIPMPLEIFGGFYESASNYYLVTGNKNPNEDDSVEVLRVTKYDKNWNPQGSCKIYGAKIKYPFEAGGCAMTLLKNMFVVYMAYEAYRTSDGLCHQHSKAITIDVNSMTEIKDGLVTGASHSFCQRALTDGTDVILADRGDGYPRGYYVHKHMYDVSGEIPRTVGWDSELVMQFPGEIGNNYTGAGMGGMECSPTHILLAGSSVYRNGATEEAFKNNYTSDAVIFALDKNTMRVTSTDWLTSFKNGEDSASTPHIVKISDNRFAVLWKQGETVYYTFIDGTGKRTGSIYSAEGELSDCVPLVRGDRIIWYTWRNEIEKFYTISISHPENITIKTLKYKVVEDPEEYYDYEDHDLIYVEKAATCQEAGVKGHYECTDCGEWFKDTNGRKALSAKEIKKQTIKKKKHSFKTKELTEEYLKSDATCTKPAVYYYACKYCGDKGKKTFKSGKKLGHEFVAGSIIKATAKKDGKIASKCIRCGKTSKGIRIAKAGKVVVLSKKSVKYIGGGQEKDAVKVVVKKSKYPLTENEYEVKYSEPVYKGKKSKGTVTVTFKPECRYYKGTMTLTYKITKVPKK